MAFFIVAVLAGENVLGFNLIDAARTLDGVRLAQVQR